MIFGLYTVISAVAGALFPGIWAFPPQALIAGVVTYLAARPYTDYRRPRRDLPIAAALAGVVGAGVFAPASLLPGLMRIGIGAPAAAALMWLGVAKVLEIRLGLHPAAARRISTLTCMASWLLWLIVGAILSMAIGAGTPTA